MNPIYQNARYRSAKSLFALVLALFLTLPMYLSAQCTANAGTFNAQDLCLQNNAATIKATPTGNVVVPTGFQVIYVLTGGDSLTILRVNSTPSFTVNNPAGLYTVHTLVYNPATLNLGIVVPGQTTGFQVNSLLVQGGGNICASLDVTGSKFRFGGCDDNCAAESGTLRADSIACLRDSVRLTARVAQAPAVPTGYQVLYVLTSGQNLVIEQVSATPSFFVKRAGRFTIHTLVYNPATLNLGIVVFGQTTGVTVNGLLIQGGGSICAALDVAGAPFDVAACPPPPCTANAGRLRANSGACLQDNMATLTATRTTQPVVPAGFQVLYVLTSGQNLVIEQVNTQPTFKVNRTGRFTIHTLVYNPATLNLGIVVFGQTTGVDVNNLLIQGGGSVCASLDVAGAPFDVAACPCAARAGRLRANSGACLTNGMATLSATRIALATIPTGYSLIYVLTSGQNLVIEQVNTQPTFKVDTAGRFTIHTLVYNPATLDLNTIVFGQTTGVDVNNLLIQGGGSICAALDVAGAPFNVAACPPPPCTANAGKLKANSGACLQNNMATLTATRTTQPVVPTGFQVLYVLTSGQNLVIEQVNAQPTFKVNRTGRFTIHTLVYNPATLNLGIVVFGQTTGVDVNNLLIQGGGSICASLDVAGAPFDVAACPPPCTANAGTLKANSGACLQSGKATLTATRVTQPVVPTGFQVLYVLTSGQNLVIEQVNAQPTFKVNRTGRFTIHTLVYNPATLNLGIVVFGQTTGVDVNNLLIQGGGSICAALDVAGAPFNIAACPPPACTADAGKLRTSRTNGNNVCLSNNRAILSATTAQSPVIPHGFKRLYVLTSGQDLVIVGVNSHPAFSVNRAGTFTIHTLIYNPATLDLGIIKLGQTTGFDVNSLLIQGGGSICGALDVAGVRFTVATCSGGGSHRVNNIYPNPTTGLFNFELIPIEGIDRVTIEVVDVNGNVAKQWQFDGKTETVNLDIESLQTGIYFVKTSYDGQFVEQTRIVKQ